MTSLITDRPATFEEVVGQAHIVTILTRLLTLGQLSEHLLLHGPHGLGKTALTRIYARALNCTSLTPAGSPCNRCDNCLGDVGLHEYDVPKRGGGKAEILAFLEAFAVVRGSHKCNILFFDEAHDLEREASDALLKAIERSDGRAVCCFATTEPERLEPALRSRLWDLEVRPLAMSTAVSLLRHHATKRGVAHDTEGLRLLAAAKRGHARDLMVALRQMEMLGENITVDSVKAVFDLQDIDVVVKYFVALADGDEALQTQVIGNWHEDDHCKIRWIKSFLTTIYYRDILGTGVEIDPLVIAAGVGRHAVISHFCARLKLDDAKDLAVYWRRWMRLWRDTAQPADVSSQRLALALFQAEVNSDLSAGISIVRSELSAEPSVVSPQHLEICPASISPAFPEAHSVVSQACALKDVDLGPVIDSASQFAQSRGAYFNVMFTVWPRPEVRRDDEKGAAAINEFLVLLKALCGGSDRDGVAYISLVEWDGGLVNRVLAFLPSLARRSSGREEIISDLCSQSRAKLGHAIEAELASVNMEGAARFHWNKARELCAGSAPALVDDADPVVDRSSLQTLFRTRKRRPAGLVRCSPIATFGAPGATALAEAARLRLPFQSVFAEAPWTEIASGWERKVHVVRMQEIDARLRDLQEVESIWGDDPVRMNIEIEAISAAWREPHWPRIPITRQVG